MEWAAESPHSGGWVLRQRSSEALLTCQRAQDATRQLAIGQETVVRTAREAFPAADAVHDEPTADLLTQRMQIHEKNAWMLRSMLA